MLLLQLPCVTALYRMMLLYNIDFELTEAALLYLLQVRT